MHVSDAIADTKATDFRASRDNLASGLTPEPRRHFLRVQPRSIVNVDEVEPYGGVVHLHLARGWRSHFDILEAHDLGTTGLVNADSSRHRDAPDD
jgi:hypothetical protein